MPCDSIQTMEVELTKMVQPLAEKAFAAISRNNAVDVNGSVISFIHDERNVTGTYDCKTGMMQVQANNAVWGGAVQEELIKRIKREYAAQVVASQAKRFGAQLKQTSPNKFQMVMR